MQDSKRDLGFNCKRWIEQLNFFVINRLRAIWPKVYQRESLRKSHQNGD